MGVAKCVRKWSSLGIILVYSLQLELCVGQIASQCGRKEKVLLTLMSFKPQNSESTVAPLPHYECYLGAEDGDNATVSSSRPYATRNTKEPQPSSPVRLTDNNLPANTAAYRVALDNDNNNAFGVFICNALKDARQNTTVFTIFLRSDGYMVPSDEIFTKTVNVGDRGVIIDMTVVNDTNIPSANQVPGNLDIRWRINGGVSVNRINERSIDYQGVDYTQFSSQGISVDDEGVYEAHGFLLRDAAQHVLQRLIVRSCVAGRWGSPGCHGICDNCYNGGVCDDETGRCICPPGFMGTNCLTACGANRFGYSCEFQCDYDGNTGCIGRQFCLLDPYGCTCNAGYMNLDCMTDCERTKYGAGCLQQCHCDDGNGRCNSFTGVCDSVGCQNGWSGTNCQIPDNCTTGYFGTDCTEKCLCMNNVACDKKSGACNNGAQCAPGASTTTGSERCQDCADGFFGDNCTGECHCESDACDKATGVCVGCCKPQWLNTTDGNMCQTGLEGSSFMKVNSGQSTRVRCDTSQSIVTTYRTELSRERDALVDSGIIRGNTSTGVNNQGSLLRTTSFTINNVSSTDVFYCLLVLAMEHVAWLNTTFSAYELPVLSDSPTLHRRTNDSVTIRWRAWDAEKDVGDPPVVSYVTYYKEEGADMWIRGSDVSPGAPLQFTAPDLKMDVNYTFSVAAVRDGDGGEGPRSPPLTVKTLCGDPAVPSNVKAILTDENRVQVSWKVSPGSVTCSTGITSFTVFEHIEGSSDEPIVIASVRGKVTSYIISEGLEDVVSYTFLVSLTTDQESAQSIRSEAVLYTLELPVLSDPPTLHIQTNDSVTIRWRAWNAEKDVGDPPVVSYVTYYKEQAADMWMRGSDVSPGAPLQFTAPDLKVDVNYTFSVAAVRDGDGGEGPRSPPLTVKTLCGDPAVPSNVEAILTDGNRVEVSWQITLGSVTCSTGITSFTVYAQIEGSSDEPKKINSVGGEITSYTISEGLEDGVSYTFLVSSTTEREGALSLRSEAVLYTSGSSPIVFIVIITFIVLVLPIVVILILVVVKRYYYRKGTQDKKESDRVESAVDTKDGVSNEPIGYSSIELDSKDAISPSDYHHLHRGQDGETMSENEETDMSKAKRKVRGLEYEDVGNSQLGRYNLPKPPTGSQTNSATEFEYHDYEDPGDFENYTGVYINIPDTHHLFSPEPIKVSEFQSFMRRDKTQLVEGIVKEFMILPKGKQYPCSVAQQHCLQRNNSQQILPYDHSRVVLTSLGNMNEFDYYNASYIKDYEGKIRFVAAQGPGSQYKINEFWRMIWQEKVKTIVMLTDSNHTVDAGSAAYWPEKVKTNETHGELTVLGMELTSYRTYTVRKMKVLHNNDDRNHTVQQIQLHMWPFRGVPEDTSDLIAVIKKVKSFQGRGTASPLLVHCSNGSGATGTFIAIYSLMDVLKESKTISVFDFVSNMKKDRMDMVQTRIQYIFIYQTLQDAQLFPEDSCLSCSQLRNLSDSILNKKAEQEFKVLRKMDENSRQTKGKIGRLATNAHKNRFKGIIPLDKYRATLKSEGLTHGSNDYINASIAENDDSGYVVMAQSPLPATVEDFWRLVYDYQCGTVIMLDSYSNTDKTFVQYWPDGRAVYASVTVNLVTSMKSDTFTKRTFTVTHQDFKEPVSVEQLVYDGLETKQDIDVNKLAKFISSTQSDRSKTLVVHCVNGVGLSAVYVVVRSLMESVKNGDECDIFLAVQKLRTRSPHAIQTQDEYILCLQLLRSILNNQEEYAVVY